MGIFLLMPFQEYSITRLKVHSFYSTFGSGCLEELSVFPDNVAHLHALSLIEPARIYSPIKLIPPSEQGDFIKGWQDALSTLLPTFISISSSFRAINSFNSFCISVDIKALLFYAPPRVTKRIALKPNLVLWKFPFISSA